MALKSSRLAGNARLQAASENRPAMNSGEPDHAAVRIIQQALIDLLKLPMPASTRPDGTLDGSYGTETIKMVRLFQTRNSLGLDGSVGRETLTKMDALFLAGPAPGPAPTPVVDPRTLALTQGRPIAFEWANFGMMALQGFEFALRSGFGNVGGLHGLTIAALETNFSWKKLPSNRQLIFVQGAIKTFGAVVGVLNAAEAKFVNVSEADAKKVFPPTATRPDIPPAFAVFGGNVSFTPRFRVRDTATNTGFGPMCRAAMVLHESVHVVDASSGQAAIHISEFDEPKYSNQTPDESLHNPSAYASFGQQIRFAKFTFPASDRFGAGRPAD